jgi:t-SNARE complex subunit (syntaxin)
MAARDRLGELRSGNTQYRSPSGSLNNLNEIGRPSGSLQNSRPSGSLNNLHEMSSRPTGSFNNLYEMSTRPAPSEFTVQINQLFSGIDRIEGNLTTIQRLHERALVGVSQDEINRITRQVDSVQDETNDLMDRVRVELKTLAEETKQEKGPEQQSRKAQQASVATKLQQVAQRYAQIQKNAKEQYKKRMEREIRIGILY